MIAGNKVLPAIFLIGLSVAVAAGATKAGQTITFAALPNKTFGDPQFTLTATASSGLPVKLTSQTVNVCKVTIDKVTLVAAGTCTVRASQAGNTKYAAAPALDQSLSVAAIPAVAALGGQNRTYNGRAQSATCTTTPTGLRTKISYVDAGSGLDRINAGQYGVICAVTQAGYTGQANGALTIARANQKIAYGHLVGKTVGDPPFAFLVTANLNLAVSVVSLTPTICTIADKTVTLQSAG